jgi:methionyl aminopeptidase
VFSHRSMGSRSTFPSFLSALARRPNAPAGRVKRADSPPVIKLKSPREIALMREAGRVVAQALDQVRRMAVPGVTTAEMDQAVAAIFHEHHAIPLFLGYPSSTKGKPPFPAVICASINEQVVKGTSFRSIRDVKSMAGAAMPR